MKNLKNKLVALLAVVFVIVGVVWMFAGGTDHIEDKNGPENYSLATITDKNIVEMDLGSIGGPNIEKSVLTGDAIEFSAEKFSGVYEILYDNYIGKSDFVLSLNSFEIYEGNFEMAIVHDDKVVKILEPGMFVDYCLEDVKGTVSLRIAGESASFKFYMSELDFDMHTHDALDD